MESDLGSDVLWGVLWSGFSIVRQKRKGSVWDRLEGDGMQKE